MPCYPQTFLSILRKPHGKYFVALIPGPLDRRVFRAKTQKRAQAHYLLKLDNPSRSVRVRLIFVTARLGRSPNSRPRNDPAAHIYLTGSKRVAMSKKSDDPSGTSVKKVPLPAYPQTVPPSQYKLEELVSLCELFDKPAVEAFAYYRSEKLWRGRATELDSRILTMAESLGIPTTDKLRLPALPVRNGSNWLENTPSQARRLIVELARQSPEWKNLFTEADKIKKPGPSSDEETRRVLEETYLSVHRYKAITGCNIGAADEHLAQVDPDKFGDTEAAVRSRRDRAGKLIDPDNRASKEGSAAYVLRHNSVLHSLGPLADVVGSWETGIAVIQPKEINDLTAVGHVFAETVDSAGGMVRRIWTNDLPVPQLAAIADGVPANMVFTIFDFTQGNGGKADEIKARLSLRPISLPTHIIRPDFEKIARFLDLLAVIEALTNEQGGRFAHASEAVPKFKEITQRSAPADFRGILKELALAVQETAGAMPCTAPPARADAASIKASIEGYKTQADAFKEFWEGRDHGVYVFPHKCGTPEHLLGWQGRPVVLEPRPHSAFIKSADRTVGERRRQQAQREEAAKLRETTPAFTAYPSGGILSGLLKG